MKLDWKWIGFQIGVPLVAPAVLSGLFLFAWRSLDADFVPYVSEVVDLTPWAIAVYSLTLIGATFERS